MTKDEVLTQLLANAKSLTANITVGGTFKQDVSEAVKALSDTNKNIVELAKTLDK